MGTRVSLPDIPEGKGLEDFVAAFFQTAGQYVERSIIQRETEEILELDLLTTAYNDSIPTYLLTEVKSGKWGFSDLFKLSGLRWLRLFGQNFPFLKWSLAVSCPYATLGNTGRLSQ
jgi:hypothetical protein